MNPVPDKWELATFAGFPSVSVTWHGHMGEWTAWHWAGRKYQWCECPDRGERRGCPHEEFKWVEIGPVSIRVSSGRTIHPVVQ
jgi:hypothetical protein